MADENTPEVEPTVQPTAPAEPTELKTLKDKVAEYERMLLDPAYLEFMSGGAARRAPASPPEPAKEIDFDSMTNKELVQFLLANLNGAVQGAVAPLQQTIQASTVINQVKEAAGKFPDFWEHRDEMIAIGRRHPTISAEEAYYLAKGRVQGAPPARRPARTEAPTGGTSTDRKVGNSFEEKFQAAFKAAGLTNRG